MNREPRDLDLKKIGKQVLFLETDEVFVRFGEGSFLRLKDGTILLAYTEYCGGDIHDNGEANLVAVYSQDEGETWSGKKMLLHHGDAINVMSVSFLRLENDEILMFYLKKTEEDGLIICRPYVRSSFDETRTWGEERCCVPKDTIYHVLNNDRVIQLQSGRIIFAVGCVDRKLGKGPNGQYVRYFISDDNGKSWKDNGVKHEMPFENLRGFEEPGVYQHDDGTLWAYYRTNIGCQFETSSTDDGDTWTVPKPNVFFTGARSPMMVKKVCGKYTVALFNPISLYTGRNLGKLRGRAPYLLAMSTTDGVGHDSAAFPNLYFLENDMDHDYCYPTILGGDDYFLVAYYHSNGRERPLNCLKVVKVNTNEF